MSLWVDRAEDPKRHPDKRKYWNDKVDERIKWGGWETDRIKKIQKEFKTLDAVVDPQWGYKHKKKHLKPPKWTGYTEYGSYTARIRPK